jgi:hypothetical protein
LSVVLSLVNCVTLLYALCFIRSDQGDEIEGLEREGLEMEGLEWERLVFLFKHFDSQCHQQLNF